MTIRDFKHEQVEKGGSEPFSLKKPLLAKKFNVFLEKPHFSAGDSCRIQANRPAKPFSDFSKAFGRQDHVGTTKTCNLFASQGCGLRRRTCAALDSSDGSSTTIAVHKLTSDQGKAEAQYTYGIHLADRHGPPKSIAKTGRDFKRSTDQNRADAQQEFGPPVMKVILAKEPSIANAVLTRVTKILVCESDLLTQVYQVS
jgi:hypothetical protein